MRLRCIVDVGAVNDVAAITHDAQPPRFCAFDQARQDVVVARPPDQARTQRDGGQVRIVRGQHGFFGDGLGGCVMRLEAVAVGHAVRGAAFDRMGGAMGHAGRGGVHQLADAMSPACVQHVVGADDVGAMVAVVTAPRARLRRVVEDGVEPRAVVAGERGQDGIAVRKIARNLAHAQRLQRGVVTAIETGGAMPALEQAAAQRLAQETSATGHQDVHSMSCNGCRAAQCASFSRPILALWRMSTGNNLG